MCASRGRLEINSGIFHSPITISLSLVCGPRAVILECCLSLSLSLHRASLSSFDGHSAAAVSSEIPIPPLFSLLSSRERESDTCAFARKESPSSIEALIGGERERLHV